MKRIAGNQTSVRVTNDAYPTDPRWVRVLVDSGVLSASSTLVIAPSPPDEILCVPERMPVLGKVSQFCHAWVIWTGRTGAAKLTWRHIS